MRAVHSEREAACGTLWRRSVLSRALASPISRIVDARLVPIALTAVEFCRHWIGTQSERTRGRFFIVFLNGTARLWRRGGRVIRDDEVRRFALFHPCHGSIQHGNINWSGCGRIAVPY